MSAQTSQAVSGAAQGAAYGSVLGPWGIAGGAVIGGVAGLISGGSADAQQENQEAWAKYNNRMRYNTSLYNIDSFLKISEMNAAATRAAANLNATAIESGAQYNAAMTFGVVQYNAELQELELERIWEDEDLALEQLATYRNRERGVIVADQAASGTVIGEGSNADVIISQQAQEALDATIIMHGADRKAADVGNAIARGRWEGTTEINKILWQGRVQSYVTRANATIQAGSQVVGSRIKANADLYSAEQAFNTGGYAVEMSQAQFNSQNVQNMTTGLFNAGGTYIGYKYAKKPLTTTPMPTSAPPPLLSAPGTPTYPGTYSGPGTSLTKGLS